MVRVHAGHASNVLDAVLAGATLRAIGVSPCKLMLTDRLGRHSERAVPGCNGVARHNETHCHMHLERPEPELRRDLVPSQLSSLDIDRVNAYISSAGSGAALHFDVRAVVVVQLVGRKCWDVSEEPAVDDPPTNCVAPPGERRFVYNGQNVEVPSMLVRYDLWPGDWLLLPRATWHRTSTDRGSVSVTLALRA